MAASTTVFAITPTLGLNLGAKGVSTPAIPVLTKVTGSDGHVYLYAKAIVAVGSITTCKIGNAGSATTDAGSAGWTANTPGGATAAQYLWVKRTTLA